MSNIIEPNKSFILLIEVEVSSTVSDGMSSQVKLIAKSDNIGKDMILVDLSNADLITVSPNQLKILSLIYRIIVKNSGSTALSNIVINDAYPAYTQ
ncbi:MAG: hypothetical protein ACN6NJ_04115 [Acinetobacter sp.]